MLRVTGVVKDIGCRQANDILQSMKPRAACAGYGDFGFRRAVGRAHRLAGRASAGRNAGRRGGMQRSWCAGSGREAVVEVIGWGANASGIAAGSTRLSDREEGEPCRVMVRRSRST